MPNTILTPNVIANEALMVLKNNLVMANLVHRDYEKEFVKVGDTVTARRPSKFAAKNFTGAVDPQELNEGGVPVKMDRLRDVTVQITSKEMSLDLRDFSAQVIEPAMTAIANAVDADVLATAVEGACRTVTASGEDAAKPIKDIAKVGSLLDFAGVPVQNRRLVLNPSHKVLYATDDNMSKVSYAGDGTALREAELGKVYTMDTYMSQNAPYPFGYLDNAVGTAKSFKVSGTAGASTVALSSVTAASATVKKGDTGAQGPAGADGIGITDAQITEAGELQITYTDGTTVLLGEVVGPKGDTGAAGKDGVNGNDGAKGDKGDKGDPGEPGASGVETWEIVFTKTFDEDTTANQQWDLANPCRKIRLRMAVAGSASNSAAGDTTVYLNSYTSKCFLPNVFRYETDAAKGSLAVAEVDITGNMVRVQTNKTNISSNFNATNVLAGNAIWNASGITFNIMRDVENHGAIKALSFPTNGKTIGSGTQVEILGVAK